MHSYVMHTESYSSLRQGMGDMLSHPAGKEWNWDFHPLHLTPNLCPFLPAHEHRVSERLSDLPLSPQPARAGDWT